MNELHRLVPELIDRLSLDLDGVTVFTEAANTPYNLAAVIAASAGARVTALARDSRHATARRSRRDVSALATRLGCRKQITFVDDWRNAAEADLVTNTGLLRPWTRAKIRRLRAGAALIVMYEAWELRPGEIDLAACGEQGVAVLGVNEHHPLCPVFDYVGTIAANILDDSGITLAGSRIGVIGADAFASAITRGLREQGAVVSKLAPGRWKTDHLDAIVFADYSGIVDVAWSTIDRKDLPCLFFTGPRVRPRLKHLRSVRPIPRFAHMVASFASLGARPVAELYALSYKAGEDFLRERRTGSWQLIGQT